MKNRAVLVILGLLLFGAGASGIVLFHKEQAKQQKEYNAKIATEQARAEEERTRAEQLTREVDAEKQKALDARNRLTAEQERRKEEELIRRKLDEERRTKELKGVEQKLGRTQPGGKSKGSRETAGQSKKYAQANTKQKSASGPAKQAGVSQRRGPERKNVINVRFKFDPSRTMVMPVARVHLGDRVQVRIKRMDGAAQRLFLGLAVPGPTGSRYPTPGRHAPATQTVVATPVKDYDEFTIAPSYDIAKELSGSLDSETGAILNIGTGRSPQGPAAHGPRRGYYQVEINIYADNQWDIGPRSLL